VFDWLKKHFINLIFPELRCDTLSLGGIELE